MQQAVAVTTKTVSPQHECARQALSALRRAGSWELGRLESFCLWTPLPLRGVDKRRRGLNQ